MVSPGVLKYPRGENGMITMIATIRASLVMNKVRVRVIVTVEFFIVFSFLSDKTAPLVVPLIFSANIIIEIRGITTNETLTKKSDRSKQNPAFCIQTRQSYTSRNIKTTGNFSTSCSRRRSAQVPLILQNKRFAAARMRQTCR